MDGNDRTKLSAIEQARQEHLKKHGSMLYCEKHDTLCSSMYGAWITGCQRKPCIKEDPDDIELQKKIQKNKERNRTKEKKKETQAAPIRNQTARIKSYEQQQLDKIHQLEEESAQAFRNNNPKRGEELFTKARFMRGELRKYIEKRKGEKE